MRQRSSLTSAVGGRLGPVGETTGGVEHDVLEDLGGRPYVRDQTHGLTGVQRHELEITLKLSQRDHVVIPTEIGAVG
jgi:hypothetical protein